MYELTDRAENSEQDRERFIDRNSRIYEGIEVKLKVKEITADKKWGKEVSVSYITSFDSAAGKIEFENQASLIKRRDGYKIIWKDHRDFPQFNRKR